MQKDAFTAAGFPQNGGTNAACANFYTSGFQLTPGTLTIPFQTLPKPPRGQPQVEESYNTCRVRVSDHVADGLTGFARNDYSRRQAFNTDSTLQLVSVYDGSWHLYNTNYEHLYGLPGPAGDAEPQWHPTDPNLLFYLPIDGIGMKIYQINVTSKISTTVADLSARIKVFWPTANAAWTKSEGAPSADGRYWCFMVDDQNWNGLGVVTYDLVQDKILGHMNVAERPDHVSMTPSGNYCLVSGTNEVFPLNYLF